MKPQFKRLLSARLMRASSTCGGSDELRQNLRRVRHFCQIDIFRLRSRMAYFTSVGRCVRGLQAADEQFALVHHLGRQVIVQLDEELLMLDPLSPPQRGIEPLQLLELLSR